MAGSATRYPIYMHHSLYVSYLEKDCAVNNEFSGYQDVFTRAQETVVRHTEET